MADDRIPTQLQESLLALLVFDDKRGSMVRTSVHLRQWDEVYRSLAERTYSYIDQYHIAPKDHLPELVVDLLQSADQAQADRCLRLLELLKQVRPTLNPEFIVGKLSDFIRRQAIKNAIIECGPIVQAGNDERLDEVESIFMAALKRRADVFSPGLRMTDIDRLIDYIREPQDAFPTGIRQLDEAHLGPRRKTYWQFIGPSGMGKTWLAIQLCSAAAAAGRRCLHVSLEMSEDELGIRYLQKVLAVAKRKADHTRGRLQFTDGASGERKLVGIKKALVKPTMTLDDPSMARKLRAKIEEYRMVMNNLRIKEFATGELTILQLVNYLDMLEAEEGFAPDLMAVDYPDLMDVGDPKFYRLALSKIVKELRGIGVKRNMAVVGLSQTNRKGAESRSPRATHAAEAWDKIPTSDVVLVGQQTEFEKQAQVARLFVDKGRSERDKFGILVTQNLDFGQFALRSFRLPPNYWEVLQPEKREREEEDDED